MRLVPVYIFLVVFIGCKNNGIKARNYTKNDLFNQINKDSLEFNISENTYYDKFGEGSGSLYGFNKEGNLIFYCFLNGKIYPFGEFYRSDGSLQNSIGKPSVQVRYFENDDKSLRISFLISAFRKSNYIIKTITSFDDTLKNNLSVARGFSNVGYFNVVVRNKELASKTSLINYVSYFDSLRNTNLLFTDTIILKDILDYDSLTKSKPQ